MPKRALSSYTSMRAEALTERACVGTGQGPQAPAGAGVSRRGRGRSRNAFGRARMYLASSTV